MLSRNFSKILAVTIFLTFDLMLLGAAVRALDAGLTCPDWPLCFGKAIPEFHLGVYLEFIHRAVAGIVAILFFGLFVLAWADRRHQRLRWLMSMGLLLLLSQVIMGGLTVLKLLAPGIVTLHLALATSFLICLLVIQSQAEETRKEARSHRLFEAVALLGFVLVCGQILLGGWVASNYAGMVCVDFPTCNGQWFPTWTGPIGAQVIHRLGAYTLAVFFLGFFIYALRLARHGKISALQKRGAIECGIIVIAQISVGILNLKLLVPAWLTVVHLGLALYLMMTILKINLLTAPKNSPG